MNDARSGYGSVVTALIAVWLAYALGGSALHLFKAEPAQPPLALGLSVLIPIVIFVVWFRTSAGFRKYALSLDIQTLTMMQSWRIAGLALVALYTANALPGLFALPAGWGDIAIGLSAPLVALKLASPSRRSGFIAWQILGMLDLVTAVAMGTGAGLINPGGVPTDLMTVFPLSLVPTFGVPLFFILHIISIAQERGWKEREYARDGQAVASPVSLG